MPLRSRVTLLAGIAASVALAGCQTSLPRGDAVATANRPGGLLAKPLAALWRRMSPAKTEVIAGPEGTVIASSRPFAAPPRPAAPAASDEGAGVWQPLQRVSAEKLASPAGQEIARAAAYTPAGGSLRASVDAPAPPAAVAVAPNDPPAPAPPAEHATQPRLEPQPVVALAPPVVAHPAAPREFAKQPLPPYVVEPPDILLIQATESLTKGFQPIDGQHLVRPDGSVSLGTYGSVYVAGSTLEEVRDAVAAQVHVAMPKVDVADIKKQLVVDVLAYNSKVYYVITDGGGYGEQVYPIAVTGNETVLDAMSKINGLPAVSSKKRIWVARATAHCDHPEILPVDWCGITRRGCADTNYQIFPGDRVYVAADPWISTDSFLAKRLNPIDRVLGTILLGSSTVNSIRGRSGTGTGG